MNVILSSVVPVILSPMAHGILSPVAHVIIRPVAHVILSPVAHMILSPVAHVIIHPVAHVILSPVAHVILSSVAHVIHSPCTLIIRHQSYMETASAVSDIYIYSPILRPFVEHYVCMWNPFPLHIRPLFPSFLHHYCLPILYGTYVLIENVFITSTFRKSNSTRTELLFYDNSNELIRAPGVSLTKVAQSSPYRYTKRANRQNAS